MAKFKNFVYTDRLKRARKSKKITIAEMSTLLSKKSAVSYFNIEQGKIEPKISAINKISAILGMPAGYFFDLYMEERSNI